MALFEISLALASYYEQSPPPEALGFQFAPVSQTSISLVSTEEPLCTSGTPIVHFSRALRASSSPFASVFSHPPLARPRSAVRRCLECLPGIPTGTQTPSRRSPALNISGKRHFCRGTPIWKSSSVSRPGRGEFARAPRGFALNGFSPSNWTPGSPPGHLHRRHSGNSEYLLSREVPLCSFGFCIESCPDCLPCGIAMLGISRARPRRKWFRCWLAVELRLSRQTSSLKLHGYFAGHRRYWRAKYCERKVCLIAFVWFPEIATNTIIRWYVRVKPVETRKWWSMFVLFISPGF